MTRSFYLALVFFLCCFFSVTSLLAYELLLEQVPPTVSGDFQVIKGEVPGTLQIRARVTCILETGEVPPGTLRFEYSLQRGSTTVSSYSALMSATWFTQFPSTNKVATIYYNFPMPDPGSTATDLASGTYTFKVTLQPSKVPPFQDAETAFFPYTVYSGNLLFNEIQTSLSTIVTGQPCQVTSDLSLLADSMTNWQAGDSVYPLAVDGFCVDKSSNGDGFSTDLTVVSGSVGPIPHILGETAGSTWGLFYVSLDKDGGSYVQSALSLPDNVSAHSFRDNQVWSKGFRGISPLGSGTFSTSLDEITLSLSNTLYFHGYGLPFYVASEGFSFSLAENNNTGLELIAPSPYYVHEDAFLSLPATDFRRDVGFASNDAMFRSENTLGQHTATISSTGLNGHLNFHGNASNIAFPKSRLTHPSFGIDLIDNKIKTGSQLTGVNPVTLTLRFDPNCQKEGCAEQADKKSFSQEALGAAFFSNGALGARFTNLGDVEEPTSSELAWGGFDNDKATFFRDDRNIPGIWLIPGFIMPGTAATPTIESENRISQILFGSFSLGIPPEPGEPVVAGNIHPLNDPADRSARRGDGFFAGINMGPETLVGANPAMPTPAAGSSSILTATLDLRFSGNSAFTSMSDRLATKYVLRQGGLTGVFNTSFGTSGSGTVEIYDYPITFSRFAFRQTLNTLSSQTFIDGQLTLPAPVGDADGMLVGFTELALTCNGNLGNGNLDAEPEPDWPNGSALTGCDGVDSADDQDERIDESCHILSYWNMPVLVTGMGFTDNGAGECSTNGRVLNLNTRNVVENLGAILTMSADFHANGTLGNQKLSGLVETSLDKPDGDPALAGFSVRLQDAYLNEVTDPDNLPAWPGFTVLTGRIDVPLFDDSQIMGHLTNSESSLHIFESGDDNDMDGITTDFDGADNDASLGDVAEFRGLLQPDSINDAPKPLFSYSWPKSELIELSYRADYQMATDFNMPQFIGIPDSNTELAGVLQIESVADYINPLQTKFSFGVSADADAMGDFLIDATDLSSGVAAFLSDQFDVDLESSLEVLLSELANAEKLMHDITGGDVSDILAEAINRGLDEPVINDPIQAAVIALNQAHQAPYMLAATLTEPFNFIEESLRQLITNPDLDLAALAPDFDIEEEVANSLLPLLSYPPEQLRALYEAYTGNTDPEFFNTLIARYERLQNAADELLSQIDQARDAKEQVITFLDESSGSLNMNIEELKGLAEEASATVDTLYDRVTVGLGAYTSADENNELLQELEAAKATLGEVRRTVANLHLGDIADVLYVASIIAGSPIDLSMLHAAEDTTNNAINELDLIINSAESNLTELLNNMPLADILATINDLLGPTGLIQTSLRGNNVAHPAQPEETGGLIGAMTLLQTLVPDMADSMGRDLDRLYACLESLLLPENIPDLPDGTTWKTLAANKSKELDEKVGQLYLQILAAGDDAESSILLKQLLTIEDASNEAFTFALVFANQENLADIMIAPLDNLLRNAFFHTLIQAITEEVTGILPNPSAEDIRAMIRGAILNRPEIAEMNRIFFEQFGFVSDIADDVVMQITHQINTMIRETIASLQQDLQDKIDSVVEDIGPGSWGVASAGIDGYALVSQDEIERIHLEAEFSFEGSPDPTSYNAALDISTMNNSDGPGGCADAGAGNMTVILSTHDVSAAMLGMDVGLREAAFGFTLSGSTPTGAFGSVFLLGEIGFETMALYDLGFEAAFGADELYFAAKGAGYFSDYQIPQAVFYLGKSCSNNNVLARFDEESAEFIGEIGPMNGVYVRGAVEVPIWNNGCALTVGVGADLGAWYFTNPSPGTYGGLLGGSAYGELGCLASLKGAMTLVGQKSGPDYSFYGSGWAAAGVGYCSPKKWKGVKDARKDDWCLTGEATFGVTYIDDWVIDGPDISCCH